MEVFKKAFKAAGLIFELSKRFPREETYALTDQVRRSSRSVCANLAEAWRKRRYEAAFVSKLTECEGEAAESQVWLYFAVECGYLSETDIREADNLLEQVLRMLSSMANRPAQWLKKRAPKQKPHPFP